MPPPHRQVLVPLLKLPEVAKAELRATLRPRLSGKQRHSVLRLQQLMEKKWLWENK